MFKLRIVATLFTLRLSRSSISAAQSICKLITAFLRRAVKVLENERNRGELCGNLERVQEEDVGEAVPLSAPDVRLMGESDRTTIAPFRDCRLSLLARVADRSSARGATGELHVMCDEGEGRERVIVILPITLSDFEAVTGMNRLDCMDMDGLLEDFGVIICKFKYRYHGPFVLS